MHFSVLGDKEICQIKLGFVLEFKYLDGKTFKEKEFSKSSAPVELGGRSIGILCNFYTFNNVGVLSSIAKDEHEFITMNAYIGTIRKPLFTNRILTISPKLVNELQKLNNI